MSSFNLSEDSRLSGSLRYPDLRLLTYHAPLIAMFHAGMTYKEIARALGRRTYGVQGSVKKLQSHGYLPLRKRQR